MMGRAGIVALKIEDGCRTIDDGAKMPSLANFVDFDHHHGDTSEFLQDVVIFFGEHRGRLGKGGKRLSYAHNMVVREGNR